MQKAMVALLDCALLLLSVMLLSFGTFVVLVGAIDLRLVFAQISPHAP